MVRDRLFIVVLVAISPVTWFVVLLTCYDVSLFARIRRFCAKVETNRLKQRTVRLVLHSLHSAGLSVSALSIYMPLLLIECKRKERIIIICMFCVFDTPGKLPPP